MTHPTIGLSLSGGGFRAAAFHLGTLQKLKELRILSKISVLSTISGGSITGAAYSITDKSWAEFQDEMINFISKRNLIWSALLTFTGLKTLIFFSVFLVSAVFLLYSNYPWLSFVCLAVMIFLFLTIQYVIFPISNEIEKLYSKYITHNASLQGLNSHFHLVIGATNLQTARPFIFTKTYMGDSTYDYFNPPVLFDPVDFPLARAVMASSCVPYAFSPVSISKQYFIDSSQFKTIEPVIVDGGVYDNQGIHKVVQNGKYSCDIVITSDAGNKLTFKGKYRNMIQIAIRSMNVFMTRIKNVQMISDVYDNHYLGNREIAYLSLGWKAENCIPGFIKNLKAGYILPSVIASHALKDEWIKSPDTYSAEISAHLKERIHYYQLQIPSKEELAAAQNVGTNLTPLKLKKINALMKQAACLTEIQIKLYCPALVKY
jgi:NTE family protein